MTFTDCSPERAPVSFAERCAKFQVPVTRIPLPRTIFHLSVTHLTHRYSARPA